MYVEEILSEAVEMTGVPATPPNGWLLFKRITRAVQWCANQGLFDATQFYIDLPVQEGGIVICPREVLTPIKININKNPAFSRNRLYEFSLSGPGEGPAINGWQWMEKNTYPLLAYLPSVGSKLNVQGDPSDDNKRISFFGLDVNGAEISETIVLNHTLQTTTNSYAVMRRVKKDVTVKALPVTTLDGTPVANFYPNETNPQYRVIKLPKKATSIHILFKCATLEVTSADDYIPLDSHIAVLHSLKAVHLAFSNQAGPSDEVDKYQKLALAALQDEQKSRNSAAELAAANEVQPAFNLNINNRDSLIAADVIDDVFDIFGPIGLPKAFDRLTDACELANNKSLDWEASEGYCDINVGEGGRIVLPRTIYRPIKINTGRGPTQMRNRWFEFHLNGPGSAKICSGDRYWDDRGMTVTVNDPAKSFRLVAINDLDADDGAEIRVYGYDSAGRWIRTPNNDLDSPDKFIDGYLFQATYAATLPDALSPEFSRITRITRDETNGYQQLLAYETDGDQAPILIGYYYPDETEPNYSVIQLGSWGQDNESLRRDCWIRMRYRKRELKIKALTDNLHVKSRMAVVAMLRAVKNQDDPGKADAYEAAALKYLTEQEASGNPSQQFSIEVSESFSSPRTGQF